MNKKRDSRNKVIELSKNRYLYNDYGRGCSGLTFLFDREVLELACVDTYFEPDVSNNKIFEHPDFVTAKAVILSMSGQVHGYEVTMINYNQFDKSVLDEGSKVTKVNSHPLLSKISSSELPALLISGRFFKSRKGTSCFELNNELTHWFVEYDEIIDIPDDYKNEIEYIKYSQALNNTYIVVVKR